MIVFATVRCSRFDRIRGSGFNVGEDGSLARHEAGHNGIYCTDYPNSEADWPPEFHMALVLDVPDDVLKQHHISMGPVDDLDDRHGEFSGHMGWVLPADVATKYLHEHKLGIDVGVLTSGVLARLDDLEDGDDLGFFKEIGSIIRQRQRASRAHRNLELGDEER